MLPLSPASAMMSLRTMIAVPRPAFDAVIAFRFAVDSFVARLSADDLAIERGDSAHPDLAFACDPTTLVRIVYGKWPIAEAEREGALRFDGDRALAERFVALFALPAKIAPPAVRG